METLSHLMHHDVSQRDIRGHVTSLRKVKMLDHVWTEEETEYSLQVINGGNMESILDRNQTKTNKSKQISNLNVLNIAFIFARNLNGNAASDTLFRERTSVEERLPVPL